MRKPNRPFTWTSIARGIAGVGLGALILGSLATPSHAEAGRALPAEMFSAPLSATAAAKLDPRLVVALARPLGSDEALRALGQQIALVGRSGDDLEFPVILKTELADAELAAMGAFPDSRVGSFVTTRVHESDLRRLAEHPGVEGIEASYRLYSALDISAPEVRATLVNQGANAVTGAGVLYGLMDDGIDITHNDFRNGQGSRIRFVWDQFEDQVVNPPSGFNYGAEYTKAQIDAGQASRFKNAGGHGSHVAGISTSDHTTFRGVAYEAEIVAVVNAGCDLFCYGQGTPNFETGEGTKGSIDGLVYMKQKADQLGRPLVVNQSQGVTMGPHDGTTFFEQAYNNLVATQNMIICVAAGNDQTAGWHGRQTVPANGQSIFQITHDTSQSQPLIVAWFEIWYEAGRQFNFQLITPSNETLSIPANTSNQGVSANNGHGDAMVAYATSNHPANGQGYVWFQIFNQTSGVQSGNWGLAVQSNAGSTGPVDLYLERNQHNLTINPSQRSNTAIIGMPGSASGVITVGSYNTRITWDSIGGNGVSDPTENPVGTISTFSSNGPLRNNTQKPDLSAPGAYIASTMSIDFAPTQNPLLIATDNIHTFFNGTSMATPHVSGAILLMLEKDPTLTPAEAKQILQNTSRTDTFTGAVPNGRYGFGKLDVAAAVNAVDGNNSGCLTATGDANGSTSVNVLDVVEVVNHIFGDPLSAEAQACADVNGDKIVNSADLPGIVDIILAGAPRQPAGAVGGRDGEVAAANELGVATWTQTVGEDVLTLEIAKAQISAMEMVFSMPRGYRMDGDPRASGVASDIAVSWNENLKQYKVVAYDLSGRGLASPSQSLTLEIPVAREYFEEEIETFVVDRIVLSDAYGRPVGLIETPASGEPGPHPGVLDFEASMSPNPLRTVSQVEYSLPASGQVTVAVYDASGRQVRMLAEGWQGAGEHSVTWDGRSEGGDRVADGVYFVRIDGSTGEQVEKITVMR